MRLGLRMGLNSRQGGGGALDPDARLYIAAVETALGTPIATALPSATSNPKRILSDFIKAEKAASRWSLHKRIYLPIYNNAAASAIDMVSRLPGTFQGLSGSVTHAAGYVQGDGVSGYFGFGVNASTVGLTINDHSEFTIIKQANTASAYSAIIANGSATAGVSAAIQMLSNASKNIEFFGASTVVGPLAVGTGIFMGSRTGVTSQSIYGRSGGSFSKVDGTASTAGNTLSTANFEAMRRGAVSPLYSTAQLGGYGLSLGMSEANASAYISNLETLYEGLTTILV